MNTRILSLRSSYAKQQGNEPVASEWLRQLQFAAANKGKLGITYAIASCPSETTEMKSIHVSIRDQLLTLKEDETPVRTYLVSTSRFGVGTEEGSLKTPIGRFRVAEKIGGDMPTGTIFQSRVPLKPADPLPPTEDLVMSRILWLDGLDEHNTNTRERFIYIHGTKHEDKIGSPASCGCIRMRNADVVELFDLVDHDTSVIIEE
jgi:lipoprotein-anchoring transpeptidase ErfK/SrfK